MIKATQRHKSKAASIGSLKAHLAYLEDPNHKDHIGKTVLPGKNYNCLGPSNDDFAQGSYASHVRYLKAREGLRGKRTDRIWDEVIYRCPYGVDLSKLERDVAEAMLVDKMGKKCACRTTWHIHPLTGAADLHILLAAKNNDIPPRITLRAEFGRDGGDQIYAAFDRLDQAIVNEINHNRSPEHRFLSRIERKREIVAEKVGTKPKLADEIAAKHPTPLAAADLPAIIKSLGYTVTKVTKSNLSVKFGQGPAVDKKRPRRFSLIDLLADIEEAQQLPTPKQAPDPGPDMA